MRAQVETLERGERYVAVQLVTEAHINRKSL